MSISNGAEFEHPTRCLELEVEVEISKRIRRKLLLFSGIVVVVFLVVSVFRSNFEKKRRNYREMPNNAIAMKTPNRAIFA